MRTTIFLVSALLASTPQAPGPSSPLLEQLDAIAQRQLAERAGVIGRIRDQPAAEVRKQEVRARILSLLGGLPEYRGPLNARVMKTTKRDGFAIDHVVFESLPGYWVTANMYLPDGGGRHPAVLMSMGHWDAGKAAGQLLSSNLAKKGFVVLAYDPVGQGERQQAYDARVGRSLIGGPTEQHFSTAPLLLAAAGNPRLQSLTLDRTPYSLRAAIDAPIHSNLHDAVIPGLALKWDLADLRALIAPRTVIWQDPTDWMGNVVGLAGDFTYTPSDPNTEHR